MSGRRGGRWGGGRRGRRRGEGYYSHQSWSVSMGRAASLCYSRIPDDHLVSEFIQLRSKRNAANRSSDPDHSTRNPNPLFPSVSDETASAMGDLVGLGLHPHDESLLELGEMDPRRDGGPTPTTRRWTADGVTLHAPPGGVHNKHPMFTHLYPGHDPLETGRPLMVLAEGVAVHEGGTSSQTQEICGGRGPREETFFYTSGNNAELVWGGRVVWGGWEKSCQRVGPLRTATSSVLQFRFPR